MRCTRMSAGLPGPKDVVCLGLLVLLNCGLVGGESLIRGGGAFGQAASSQDPTCQAFDELSRIIQQRAAALPHLREKLSAKGGEVLFEGPTEVEPCRHLSASITLSMDIHTVYPFDMRDEDRKLVRLREQFAGLGTSDADAYAKEHERLHLAVQTASNAIVEWFSALLSDLVKARGLQVEFEFLGKADATGLADEKYLTTIKESIPSENLKAGERVSNIGIAVLRIVGFSEAIRSDASYVQLIKDERLKRDDLRQNDPYDKQEFPEIGASYRGVRISIDIRREPTPKPSHVLVKETPEVAFVHEPFAYMILAKPESSSLAAEISDRLDERLRFIDADPLPSRREGQLLSWSFAPEVERRIRLVVASELPGRITNCADLKPEREEGSSDCGTTEVLTATIAKTGPSGRLHQGDPLEYAIQAAIPSNVPLGEGLRVSDRLPEGLAFREADPPPNRREGSLLVWNLDARSNPTIRLTVRAMATGTIENCADLSYRDHPLDRGCHSVEVLPHRPELDLRKTVSPERIELGEEAEFRLRARNVSSEFGAKVTLLDPIPDQVTVLSAVPPATSQEGRELSWRLELAPSQETTIVLKVRPEAIGEYRNCARFDLPGQAPSCGGLEVVERPLELIIADQETPCAPHTLSFPVDVSNPNLRPMDGLSLEASFAPALRREGDPPVHLRTDFKVEAKAMLRETFPFAARVAGEHAVRTKLAYGDRSVEKGAKVTVLAPRLELVLAESVVAVVPGESFEIRMEVFNRSPFKAYDLTVGPRVQEFPAGFSLADPQSASASRRELGPGESFRHSYAVNISRLTQGEFRFATHASALCADDWGQVSDIVSWGLAEPDIHMRQVNDSVRAGEVAEYEVEITNQGRVYDEDLVVTIELPGSFAFVDSDLPSLASTIEDQRPILRASFQRLEAKASKKLRYRVTTHQPGSHRVTATLESATLQGGGVARKTLITQTAPAK